MTAAGDLEVSIFKLSLSVGWSLMCWTCVLGEHERKIFFKQVEKVCYAEPDKVKNNLLTIFHST